MPWPRPSARDADHRRPAPRERPAHLTADRGYSRDQGRQAGRQLPQLAGPGRPAALAPAMSHQRCWPWAAPCRHALACDDGRRAASLVVVLLGPRLRARPGCRGRCVAVPGILRRRRALRHLLCLRAVRLAAGGHRRFQARIAAAAMGPMGGQLTPEGLSLTPSDRPSDRPGSWSEAGALPGPGSPRCPRAFGSCRRRNLSRWRRGRRSERSVPC
jgi:hypothetical protein